MKKTTQEKPIIFFSVFPDICDRFPVEKTDELKKSRVADPSRFTGAVIYRKGCGAAWYASVLRIQNDASREQMRLAKHGLADDEFDDWAVESGTIIYLHKFVKVAGPKLGPGQVPQDKKYLSYQEAEKVVGGRPWDAECLAEKPVQGELF